MERRSPPRFQCGASLQQTCALDRVSLGSLPRGIHAGGNMLPACNVFRRHIVLALACGASLFFAGAQQLHASFGRGNHDVVAKSENGDYLVEANWAENFKGPVAPSW